MISFLFFVKIAQNGELRSGDLFPHVFRKDLKNLWCTVPPQVPPSIQSGQQNGRVPRRTVNGRLRTMQRPVSPVSRPPV